MSFSSETSGNGMQRLQQPARYHETDASGGAAAGLGSSSNDAPPRVGDSWSHGNAGEEDKENTPRNIQQRYTWESTERSSQEEDDDPVYVGECHSSIPVGAPAEEFNKPITDSEDVRCMGSEAKNTGRTKEVEALVATSEDIVSRYSRPASGGGEWRSEEDGDADGEDSDTTIGGALSDDLRFEHMDAKVVAQPNISAHKLRKTWKKAVSKWNDVKAKCRSGDTEPLTDMCEEGDTDTQYMSEALAKEPQLLEFCWAELPEGQGREEGEVEVDREGGGPGDAQRRKERALTSKERTESLGAVRKKVRLEKEAVVKSTAAVESACSILAPYVESVMASIRSPQNGGEAAPKVSEEHAKRMNNIEFENAKRDKALADEKSRAELAKVKLEIFGELLNKYERVEKELKDAEEGGRSPFVIATLQEMQKNLKSQIIERHK